MNCILVQMCVCTVLCTVLYFYIAECALYMCVHDLANPLLFADNVMFQQLRILHLLLIHFVSFFPLIPIGLVFCSWYWFRQRLVSTLRLLRSSFHHFLLWGDGLFLGVVARIALMIVAVKFYTYVSISMAVISWVSGGDGRELCSCFLSSFQFVLA